jgi:hypothetical protein
MSVPQMQAIDLAPLLEDYGKLQRKPLDFSAVEAANSLRRSTAQRDVGTSLNLAMFGDDRMADAGRSVLTKALAHADPLRMNAADVAYEGPGGKMAVNPYQERAGEEKHLQEKINTAIKQNEFLMTKAIEQNKMREADQYKQAILGLMAQGNAIKQSVADAAQTKADKAGGGGGKLTRGEQKDLLDAGKGIDSMKRIADSFKDVYAGGVTGTPGVEMSNYAARNFPKALEYFAEPKTIAGMREKAEFWANQKYFDEMPTRHTMFGAALTAPEIASWKAAAIQPGMDPKDIKSNLALRKTIAENAAERMRDMHLAGGKSEAQVDAALGRTGKGAGEGWTVLANGVKVREKK